MSMSKIKLTGGFTMMEEGEQVLEITKVEFDADFGKMTITMNNAKGQRHVERFSFFGADGATNDKAMGAFSSLAKAAMGDSSAEEVDTDELVGHLVKVTISYREYEDKDGNTRKTTQKAPGTWWEAVTDEEYDLFVDTKVETAKPKVDLNALFGKK